MKPEDIYIVSFERGPRAYRVTYHVFLNYSPFAPQRARCFNYTVCEIRKE